MATAFSISYNTHELDREILTNIDSTGDSTAKHTPGTVVNCVDGRQWKYVKFTSSAVAAVAGAPACWAATTIENGQVVTADISDSSGATSGEGFAGVFVSILTDQYFGWIQTKGKVVVKLSSTCAVGSAITVMADSVFSTVSGQTGIAVGTALEAGSADASNVFPTVVLLDH